MLKLIILIICFQAYRSVDCASDWHINIPVSVTALKSSCVVLPCAYNYPDPPRNITSWKGYWFFGETVPVYDQETKKVDNNYRTHTSLLGKLKEKNCSLEITDIRRSHDGQYWFRIEMAGHDNYSFKNYKVTISVKDEADRPSLSGGETEVRSGDSVTVSCSVFHSCPSHPPTFTWSHAGTITTQSEPLKDGQHKLTSSLTFNASASDHQGTITCSVQHHGGKTASSSSSILKVRYAPVNVTIDPWEPSVLQNSSVELRCSAVANPPISSYHWPSESGRPPTQGDALTLPSVARSIHTISCVARNSEGESTSRAMRINVEYPPEVSEGSFCSTRPSGTQCNCTIMSNPPSTVKWVWGHNSKESPRVQNGSVTMAIDVLPPGLHEVACLATNKHGNAVKMLHVKNDLQYVYILVGVGVAATLVLMVILTIGLRKCCRKQQQKKEMGNPVYYDRENTGAKPCSKGKEEDVYGNDDMSQVENEEIYANTAYGCGADTSDDIYANY